ncbi:phosphohistidine phosphatase SixA [Shewanella intestini]|uniref:Phosphohistidine phosphatase SixA n=1 Tax=Shewanella intestini TaxID=2017544 RepID=A0ABS5I0B5_9GAMM|nr:MULTISPECIES: phosphohistidine phosphatase SixA [Shewanella]MBR9727474.1 phosphohistidine phosphatase SixA [Shewanella intestini]MRG35476.1 phosphohistidine phosphatase SixA [Shewanella sp. XMDDZSB0408]
MQLFLMRHGESGFDAPSDRERTLSDLGRHQTRQMGKWLSDKLDHCDLVIVSPYIRAQQTWQEVSHYLPEPGHCITLDDVTPNADPKYATDTILAYAQQYDAQNVLVITHMPVVGYLVHELDISVEPPMFATSAVAHLEKHYENADFKGMFTPNTIT